MLLPDPNTLPERSQADLEWARDQLKDVLCGCVLNLKLKKAGLCPMYYFDMSEADYWQYGKILEDLLFKRRS